MVINCNNQIMICRITDLITEVPAAGGMAPRCEDYRIETDLPAEIIIREECYRFDIMSELTDNDKIYLQSGSQFYVQLLNYDGLMLHASAVELDGQAYLFSGPCGRGKSTHTRLWQQVFGHRAQVFNDDKPALRRLDGRWYAYGTPWCGKDGINQNKKVPLAGICFLVQAPENRIRRLEPKEALGLLVEQTTRKMSSPEKMLKLLSLLEQLIQEIPIFQLENRPEPEAALLSYETMHRSAKENTP